MPAPHTISKGLTEAQYAAFEKARKKAGLTVNQAKEAMLQMFCHGQGVEWPKTSQHGGIRTYKNNRD